ncbi:NUDIX domain-containing protein [Streptomyces sp. NPDC050263]|uniref:NUDIX domain-containing protein n=1 Tax=Streptomyces sp. NPDC050263 TaxID=3155037 RepID=UPI0034242719
MPGGRTRASDTDAQATAVRELEEELDGYTHRSDRAVLTELGAVQAVQPSRTHGALTGYRVTFFQASGAAQADPSGPVRCRTCRSRGR